MRHGAKPALSSVTSFRNCPTSLLSFAFSQNIRSGQEDLILPISLSCSKGKDSGALLSLFGGLGGLKAGLAARLTAATGRTTAQGLTAQLEAQGADGDVQLGAGDVPLLHEDLLLDSDALVDEAGVLGGGPVRAHLRAEHLSGSGGRRSCWEWAVPRGAGVGPGGEPCSTAKPGPQGEAPGGSDSSSRFFGESGSEFPQPGAQLRATCAPKTVLSHQRKHLRMPEGAPSTLSPPGS